MQTAECLPSREVLPCYVTNDMGHHTQIMPKCLHHRADYFQVMVKHTYRLTRNFFLYHMPLNMVKRTC